MDNRREDLLENAELNQRQIDHKGCLSPVWQHRQSEVDLNHKTHAPIRLASVSGCMGLCRGGSRGHHGSTLAMRRQEDPFQVVS